MFIRFDVIHERDGRTDRQTLHDRKDRAYASHPAVKTRIMLSRFHLIPERYGKTDGRTDRFVISISRVSMLTRDKNRALLVFLHNVVGPSAMHTHLMMFIQHCIV